MFQTKYIEVPFRTHAALVSKKWSKAGPNDAGTLALTYDMFLCVLEAAVDVWVWCVLHCMWCCPVLCAHLCVLHHWTAAPIMECPEEDEHETNSEAGSKTGTI